MRRPKIGHDRARRGLAGPLLLAVSLLGAWSAVVTPPSGSPVGDWLTADGDGVIAIASCGGELCGRIVGMSRLTRRDGGPVLDWQVRPQCGLTILRETRQTDTGLWAGRITNPDDGTNWNCEFWVAADGLHLRGYVLLPLLGQTQIWQRYTRQLGPDCRMG